MGIVLGESVSEIRSRVLLVLSTFIPPVQFVIVGMILKF
ncbi:hypothetical protein NSE_0414 [Neorickettsia sennetsu str. Miyayama]|uniref:Uncharacterized protein n=1 Tax=Ehrlichia sennetsu (strain ATCC VR-367 / Miyayama) TaxID=222891 RepID=Q2GDZ6_EHRS3|nr:hypothetical protein NSE_0414 [Neorickettsia sennetsu str. Miyayama]